MSKPPTDRFSPDGSLAYVANNGSPSVSVIDTASSSVLLSTVLMDNAQEAAEPNVGVVASFFLAVGMLATEFATGGRQVIPMVIEAAPERFAGWKRLCERLAPTRPEFAEVAAMLDGPSVENG